jgi:SAM-dependent methyltransferase
MNRVLMAGVSSKELSGIRDKLPDVEPAQTLVEQIREIVRFVLPPVARIAVVTDGKNGLLHLQGRPTWPLPKDRDGVYCGPHPANDGEAIAQVERVRSEGAQFLLIPKSAFWWLDYYDGLRRHLAGLYRVAFRDEETCMIIALHHETDPPDAGGAPDGLPLPPPELMAMTTGTYSARAFWESGEITSGWIRKILLANGLDIASFERILDFGSGCGRVIRYWKDLSGPVLSGADYNPYLVRWCRHNLAFADFQRVAHLKPLLYDDETFDLIYSYSVFTHLDLDSQRFWIDELQRLLRPGGFMYLTLRGPRYAEVLTPEERQRFDAGELVVQEEGVSGSNACLAHHPEPYVREQLAPQLSIVDLVPSDEAGEKGDPWLDAVIYRKT